MKRKHICESEREKENVFDTRWYDEDEIATRYFCIDGVVKSRFDIFIGYMGIGNINYSIRFLIVVSLKFDYTYS
jgi:hypothetical protein